MLSSGRAAVERRNPTETRELQPLTAVLIPPLPLLLGVHPVDLDGVITEKTYPFGFKLLSETFSIERRETGQRRGDISKMNLFRSGIPWNTNICKDLKRPSVGTLRGAF